MLRFGLDDLMDNSKLGKMAIAFSAMDVFNTKITWNTDSRHADRIRRTVYVGASYFQPLTVLNSQLFTAGVGLKLSVFRIDYAYRGHELGGSHRISTAIQL